MSEPLRNIKIDTPDNPNKEVYDILVIDKSSSMSYQAQPTIEGINTYVQGLKNSGLKTFIAVVQFGSTVDVMMDFIDVKEMVEMTRENYHPYGNTALNDAVGKAIEMMREKLKGREDSDDIDATITVFTDGHENASVRYPNAYGTKENAELKGEIKELSDTFKWTFSFVGAGTQEAVQEVARSMNIANSTSYSFGLEGTTSAFADLNSARITKSNLFSRGIKSPVGYFDNTADATIPTK